MRSRPFLLAATAITAAAALGGCVAPAVEAARAPAPPPVADAAPAAVTARLAAIAAQPEVGAIGLARIEGGRVAWTAYAGARAPGVAADDATWFNAASVAKTVLAETVLRLVAAGRLGLDDPLVDHHVHPDLADDPRAALLTPRRVLSHQSGLRNWASDYPDGKLAFVATPGDGRIRYSGAAIEMLRAYLEARFGEPYPALVERYLFAPLGVEEVEVVRAPHVAPMAQGVDATGGWLPAFLRYEGGDIIAPGEVSAADNLYATVPGYAKLLAGIGAGTGLDPALVAARMRLAARDDTPGSGYACEVADCPDPLGFGLGWALFGSDTRTIVHHSGNDVAEHAQVWFEPETGDGVVLFMTGQALFDDAIAILRTVDPEAPLVTYYDQMFAKYFP
ncbi:serine hydrolase domain-containing protein [Sphingomicrobium astaxanthinifaciens]|uniref:serine hydrolase domain-containing protein n=1 Tax=Sphingomicrobium astaxanthinifaciens TaxID=1227949 RepID=UPI001FCBFC83|nr:serine hydrolase domain-containing protein [Sphingomicrobium astaxanthinifaciens]MCJ7421678.1 beta-lactamase family protein [Sphingomicrobium astaxanthinifaciens]